jgi:Zn-dependent protease
MDPEPAPDPRFPDEEQERDYHVASELFINPPRVQEKSKLLLTSLAMFVAVSVLQGGSSITELATLVGVLMVHELGHALGMLVFGYSDVRIFFIPLFGAAAAGRKRNVSRWKEGVVLLMGPMPGLIAGTILLVMGADGLLRTVALQLIAINAFNLLPLAPLDGGQLFQLLLFSRHRHSEIAFQVIAALALAAGGAYLKLWVLAIVGVFILIRIPLRKNVLAAGSKLRGEGLPQDPLALDDPQRRTLFGAMWSVMPPLWRGKHAIQAAQMDQILDVATRKPTGLGVSLGLFVGWAAGIGVTVLAVIAFLGGPPAHWQRYEDKAHTFSIELPAAPTETATDVAGQGVLSAKLGRGGEFGVTWIPVSDVMPWRERLRENFSTTQGKLISEVEMPDGDSALITEVAGRRGWLLVRGETPTAYIVMAFGSDEMSERVIRSFRVLPR